MELDEQHLRVCAENNAKPSEGAALMLQLRKLTAICIALNVRFMRAHTRSFWPASPHLRVWLLIGSRGALATSEARYTICRMIRGRCRYNRRLSCRTFTDLGNGWSGVCLRCSYRCAALVQEGMFTLGNVYCGS